MIKINNYINGEIKPPFSGNYIDNYNPATGKVYSLIADSDEKDIEFAVKSARAAFKSWSSLNHDVRANYLYKISELIKENLNELAKAESIDNGKPIWLAKSVDIPRASSNFEFYASAIRHFASESHSTSETILNYTLRKPIGLVGCISPWNLPLYLLSWKIAPALAAGNCVIAKPSEITPMTAFMLSQLCIKADLPKGVLNIIHGYGNKPGKAIASHPEISAISFTGGTQTGSEIATTVAPMFKKLSLELGGKNPNIIFEDCDFEHALNTTVKSSFSNQGEICLCGSRIFIEKSIYKKFKTAFVNETAKLKVGDPDNEQSSLGAIVSEQHFNKILSCIELAKKEGGRILHGGKSIKINGRCANGWFIEPTIIEELSNECRTNQEEVFGPVVTLIPFEKEEEVIELANGTKYGLSATIWTKDLNKAHRVAANIQCGIIWVNCWLLRDLRTPFGGMKHSGLGREGGWEALRFFTEPKNVCIKF